MTEAPPGTRQPPDEAAWFAAEPDRGRHANRPSEFPAPAWRDIAKRVARETKADNIPLLAAGVAFFGLLALFPALVAIVSVYGLVADPKQVATQVHDLTRALPPEASRLLVHQVTLIAAKTSSTLGISAALGIALALWSASSGMKWLLSALSLAYDESEDRRFVRLRGTALLLTLAASVAFAMTLALITASSGLSRWLGLGNAGQVVIGVLRWPLLAALALVGLSVLYRYGPDREQAKWRWVSWGSVIATLVALVASAAFAVYSSVSSSLDKTYGSFGGIIVLMLWLLLTVFAVLLGAEVNAEMEHQTASDTTTGPSRSLGDRGAVDADEVASSPWPPARTKP